MNYKLFFKSYLFGKIAMFIGIIIIAMFIFQAGIFVGYRKAAFSYNLGDNYYRTFGSPRGEPMMMGKFPRGEGFVNPHGANGKIIEISLPTIVVTGPDGIEKQITVNEKTDIRRFHEYLKPTDLKLDDMVIIIGTPDNTGKIEARLIRMLPPPPQVSTTSTAVIKK